MIFPSKNYWNKHRIGNDLHRFFVLLWSELVDPRTPDTWQPRTANLRTVLREIASAAEISQDYPPYRHNLPFLIDEAVSLADHDPVASRHFLFLPRYLGIIKGEPCQKDDQSHNVENVRQKAMVAHGNIRAMRFYTVTDLRDALREGNLAQAERVNRLTMSLATHWCLAGYSMGHLNDGLRFLLDESEPDFLVRFDKLCEYCSGLRKKFVCRFAVSWARQLPLQDHHELHLRFLVADPPEEKSRAESRFYSQVRSDSVLAEIEVKAVDPRAARQFAEERLANAFAGLNLYEVRQTFSAHSQLALIRNLESHDDWALEPVDPTLPQIWNSRTSTEQFRDLLKLAGRLHRADRDQISSAMQYHRLALNAGTAEARLVNLWIALESITRRGKSDSIIGSVCNVVAPNVAGGNIRKIVSAVATYIRRFWTPENVEKFLRLFPNSNEKHLRPLDLLEVILEGSRGSRYQQLLNFISAHVLLKYRVEHLARYLDSPKTVHAMLNRHRNNIDWQLRRIYRARNDVMHRGRGTPSLARLTQHLHTYFLTVMHNLIEDLKCYKEWSVSSVLAHRQMLFDQYLSLLKPETSITISALFDPAECLLTRTEKQAWPAKVDIDPKPGPDQPANAEKK